MVGDPGGVRAHRADHRHPGVPHRRRAAAPDRRPPSRSPFPRDSGHPTRRWRPQMSRVRPGTAAGPCDPLTGAGPDERHSVRRNAPRPRPTSVQRSARRHRPSAGCSMPERHPGRSDAELHGGSVGASSHQRCTASAATVETLAPSRLWVGAPARRSGVAGRATSRRADSRGCSTNCLTGRVVVSVPHRAPAGRGAGSGWRRVDDLAAGGRVEHRRPAGHLVGARRSVDLAATTEPRQAAAGGRAGSDRAAERPQRISARCCDRVRRRGKPGRVAADWPIGARRPRARRQGLPRSASWSGLADRGHRAGGPAVRRSSRASPAERGAVARASSTGAGITRRSWILEADGRRSAQPASADAAPTPTATLEIPARWATRPVAHCCWEHGTERSRQERRRLLRRSTPGALAARRRPYAELDETSEAAYGRVGCPEFARLDAPGVARRRRHFRGGAAGG